MILVKVIQVTENSSLLRTEPVVKSPWSVCADFKVTAGDGHVARWTHKTGLFSGANTFVGPR